MMFETPSTIEPTQAIQATSESFGEVVRLLEEEKSTLERKLDTATKASVSVGNSVGIYKRSWMEGYILKQRA